MIPGGMSDLTIPEYDVLAAAYHGQKGYEVGYRKGLDAAREAVADALERGLATSTDKALYYFEADEDDPTIGYDVTFHKQDLLTAIDALKEERK